MPYPRDQIDFLKQPRLIAKAVDPDSEKPTGMRLFQVGVLKPGVGHPCDRWLVYHAESEDAPAPDYPVFPTLQQYLKFSCNVRWVEVQAPITEVVEQTTGADPSTGVWTSGLRIGTCSWKYPSWRGLVYTDSPTPDYLREYAQRYDTVEVDQWFWSLHGPDKVVLPQPKVVAEYAQSVPDTFRFGVKMPNALTLTHFHQTAKTDPLMPNPHFLSLDLLHGFLDRLAPMSGKLGPMMFQFGYLNRQMLRTQAEFQDKLGAFVQALPAGFTWCVETRNPNYLNAGYFTFLREHGLAHVFLQGYYMPPIIDIYGKHADLLTENVVIRLHGPDRGGMEERTGKDWSKIVEPRDADLNGVAGMLKDAAVRRLTASVFVNNHFEGCAPLTIERMRERMGNVA